VLVFPYTPYGAVSKTVHFILDGTEMKTVTTSVSARQQTYIIPQQSHGAHTLRVYFESTVNGNTVRSTNCTTRSSGTGFPKTRRLSRPHITSSQSCSSPR
jgi:hypothetical protein